MTFTENNLQSKWLTRLRKVFLIATCFIIAMSICAIVIIIKNILHERKLERESIIYTILVQTAIWAIMLSALTAPLSIALYFVRKRLICKIKFSSTDYIEITTYNNQTFAFTRPFDIVKKRPDYPLQFLRSNRMGVFINLTFSQARAFVFIIEKRKFYLMPFLFNEDIFPFNIDETFS